MPDFVSKLVAFHSDWQNIGEVLGYIAACLTIATYSVRTMIPLRVIGICANCLFILYGYFCEVYPQLLLHAILLPLNSIRLAQMIRLVSLVKQASESDLSMDWIKTFTKTRVCLSGETIFKKGDRADGMFYVASGRYVLVESNIEILPGQVIGEMGLVAPRGQRTQSFRCVENGELLTMTYSQVRQLYFQNPRFGFFFLRLITQRLFANNIALEERLAAQQR